MGKLMDRWNNKKQRLRYDLRKEGLRVEEAMHNIVAIDTGALDESIKTSQVKVEGSTQTVSVGSHGVDYAQYVDKLKTETKNYHRHGGVVYRGKGQNFLKRAVEIAKPQIGGVPLRPSVKNTFQ